MILFMLQCGREHIFEAWFRDGATYDAQAAAGEVCCPVCADTAISKAPMAPRIGKGMADRAPAVAEATTETDSATDSTSDTDQAGPESAPGTAPVSPGAGKAITDPRMREMAKIRTALLTLKKMVQDKCDYVGPAFASEARRIHAGESDERAIYGEATDEEAEALADEGIAVGRIPWPSESDA